MSRKTSGSKILARALLRTFFVLLATPSLGLVALTALNFPYSYDRPLTEKEIKDAQIYYAQAYLKPTDATSASKEYETKYLRIAKEAAHALKIEDLVREFVDEYNLKSKAVLEIGSGRGYLQDLVENYTGLDISPSVARFYHKKFVLGSATALPFEDSSFDAAWSIWVFEHVPNPEQAFAEMRRVAKNGAVLFISPAWNVPVWAAEGYPVRPYSDFGLFGKFLKTTVVLRQSRNILALQTLPVRFIRSRFSGDGPTTLLYRRLTPNYETYWMPDSDAVNSIDSYEVMLWFTSRGDRCLNCGDDPIFLPLGHSPLIIRVNK